MKCYANKFACSVAFRLLNDQVDGHGACPTSYLYNAVDERHWLHVCSVINYDRYICMLIHCTHSSEIVANTQTYDLEKVPARQLGFELKLFYLHIFQSSD